MNMHFDGELVIKNYRRIDDHRPDSDEDTESLEEEVVEPIFEKAVQAAFASELGQNSIKYWIMALNVKKGQSFKTRSVIYEGAVAHLPYSYKLWNLYLTEAVEEANKYSVLSDFHSSVNSIFERSLLYLHKMPRIWLNYAAFLATQKQITKTRLTYNKSLQALPLTQHEKIWESFTVWVMSIDSHSTSLSVLRRYVMFNPDFKETYVEYCNRIENYDEAAKILKEILEDDRFYSKTGKSEYDFFFELANIVSSHPDKISSVNGEEVIKYGMKKYTDEVGNLWILLANFYLRLGLFQKARDTFEEALSKVETAKDFEVVFKAYVDYHEEYISQLAMEDQEESKKETKTLLDLESRIAKALNIANSEFSVIDIEQEDVETDLDILMEKMDELLTRRPLLLNDCLLRQNPNNIKEWLNRFEIVSSNDFALRKAFGEAINFIDPLKAENGLFSEIWIKYALYFISNKNYKEANLVFFKASSVSFKTLEEHINIWTKWVEILLELRFYSDALSVAKLALFGKFENGRGKHDDQLRLSPTLWSLYVDLENNFGTFETTRAAYKKMMDLNIITPFSLINFAEFLQENHYYEESFRVYETGTNIFPWPSVLDVWLAYLHSFNSRYKDEKIERSRDLFERVLSVAPMNVFFFYSAFQSLLLNVC